ncbi:MAG: tryptophan synthase subunit beta, partial [Deltaproteobacteria bacterium]|nr:tryptophan synthase subunit beta [Deltaproteobacteria bacterium]
MNKSPNHQILKSPNNSGHFGLYGGRFVPETFMPAITELDSAYRKARQDAGFKKELNQILKHYVGRPTPLYEAKGLQ